MPRIGRIVVNNYPHHVTQRGNYKNTVFIEKSDYRQYLEWVDMYAQKNGLSFLAYCLMPNHVHYIAIPQNNDSLARTFNITHMRYSQYFNRKKSAIGHLWQGRFYSCVLDNCHLYAAIRYIENNPVRAKLVKNVIDWDWSSARYHVTKEKPVLSIVDSNKYMQIDAWKDYLSEPDKSDLIRNIKANTLTGRPLGSDEFVTGIENIFNTRLRPLARGRPRKEC